MHFIKLFALPALGILFSNIAAAADPKPWAIGLPEAASTLAAELNGFHNDILMPLITGIMLFVLALLIYVCWRFSAKRNPVASKTTHNTSLEILWTGVPIIILALLFIPSMKVLYLSDATGNPDMTLKVTGHQWYWNYEYPDYDEFSFDALMAEEQDLPASQRHLYKMMTDNIVVLPTDTKIRIQVTAADVLHNWSISDFGVRTDAVPGRLNEAWVQITKTGFYFGFCSELCGANHAFMPVTVQAVSPAEFAVWVEEAKQQFAKNPSALKIAGN